MLAYFVPILIAISCAMAAPAEQTQFSRSISQFSNDLYKNVADKAAGNVILSPYSVAVALALASQGAQGETFEEIKNGLHMSGDQAAIAEQFKTSHTELSNNIGKATLNVANKVYVKTGRELKESFKTVAVEKFSSEAESINFADAVPASAKINTWVEDKTNHKIKDLIKPDVLDEDTRLVLVNAIYFKGNWQHQFKKDKTKKEAFWISEDKSVNVDMMHIKEDFKFGVFDELDASGLEMNYNDSDITFLILLPNKRTGLKDLETKLANVNLNDLTSRMYKSEVDVALPKFKVEHEIEMTDVLKELGIKKMFKGADFSNLLTSPEPLEVSSVIHKAFIEVNEEGAEAAAATATIAFTYSMRQLPPPKKFNADHPFLYSIQHQGQVLFMGRQSAESN